LEKVYKLPERKKRKRESHKGDYGKIFIIAGSPGLTGAAYLAGEAAARSGAGLVTLGVPCRLNPILEAKTAHVMTRPLPDTKEGYLHFEAEDEILEFAANCDAVAIGPGIGRHEYTGRLIHSLLPKLEVPVVIDADGLNLLSSDVGTLGKRSAPAILTPHPGEMAGLTGKGIKDIRKDPARAAGELAKKYGVIVVLKSHPSVVTDGKSCYTNETGNPGMATGGTGDVLTGITASLIGQKYKPFGAACLASYILGAAGDIAAADIGEEPLVPPDIIDYLPAVFALGW